MAAYAGIDVAVSKRKRLPIAICTRQRDRVEPLALNTTRGDIHLLLAGSATEIQAASSSSAKRIGTSTPSANRAAITSSPFIASMNLRSVPT